MVTTASMKSDVESKLTAMGVPITIKYWASGVVVYSGGDYDEEYLPTGSNSVGSATVVSGLGFVQPLGNSEKQYLEQGKLGVDDVKMYVHGSLATDPNMMVTVGNGGSVYDVAPAGVIHYRAGSEVVYKKCFLRLNTGSYGLF